MPREESRRVRTVCVVTGSRADYGHLKPVLAALRGPFRLQIVATGMHLVRSRGHTVDEIRRDGFHVNREVPVLQRGDDAASMARAAGRATLGLTNAFEALRPDVVLVLGDRVEILGAAIAATYSGRVLAHIHGGDTSLGGYDEYGRHAISKLAHVHFPATRTSAKRLRRMGEDPKRIHVVGSPGLDVALGSRLPDSRPLRKRLGLGHGPYALFVMHPVSTGPDAARVELRQTLDATLGVGLPVLAVAPNTDAGGERMLAEYRRVRRGLHVVPNLAYREYLALLRDTRVLVGNSSSGIVEAPTFRVPVINVGPRQAGRERAANVLDAPPRAANVRRALHRALHDETFRGRLRRVRNPYGDGHAAQRIVQHLARLRITTDLFMKRFHD